MTELSKLDHEPESLPDTVPIPRTLFEFLMGRGPIEGKWFGDLDDHLPGKFWWRALLDTCENATSSEDLMPADVIRLVRAARIVAFEGADEDALRDLDRASEAFAARVPWENEPSTGEKPPKSAQPSPISRDHPHDRSNDIT